MDVIGDIVARERRSDRLALRTARDRRHSYRDLCTTAWKAGNFLRYLGVHRGDRVAIAPDPRPQPLFTFFGASLLGATTSFSPVADDDARAVVVAAEREDEFDLPPGSSLVVYGGDPDSPSVAHWEESVWSENPAFPPTDIDPKASVVADDETSHTHRELLTAAQAVVEDAELEPDVSVSVRASLSDPRTLVAGVLAPLLADGAVVLPSADVTGDVAVVDAGGRDVPEPESFCLDRVRM